jgi:hypothetical protein
VDSESRVAGIAASSTINPGSTAQLCGSSQPGASSTWRMRLQLSQRTMFP